MSDARIGNVSGGLMQDGLVFLGEPGPELVTFPKDTNVYPPTSNGDEHRIIVYLDARKVAEIIGGTWNSRKAEGASHE